MKKFWDWITVLVKWIFVSGAGTKGVVVVWLVFLWFGPKKPPSESPPPPATVCEIDEVKAKWPRRVDLPKLLEGSEVETELVEGSSSTVDQPHVGENNVSAVEASAAECRDLETIGDPIHLSALTSSPILAESSATAEQGQSETEGQNEKDREYSVELLYWWQQRSVFVEIQYYLSKSQDRTVKLESSLAEHREQGSSAEKLQQIERALNKNKQETKEFEERLFRLAEELLKLEEDHPEVKAKAREKSAAYLRNSTLDESIARVSQEIADLERRNPHFKARSKAKTTSRSKSKLRGSSSGAPKNPDIGALPGPSGSGTRRITSGEQAKGESHAGGPGDIEIRPDQ